jgi:hypothetical protein
VIIPQIGEDNGKLTTWRHTTIIIIIIIMIIILLLLILILIIEIMVKRG